MCGIFFFFFQAEDGIRDVAVTGVQTCALPISSSRELGWRLKLADDGNGPLFEGLGDERMSVGLFASNGKEQGSRLYSTGVIGKGLYCGVEVSTNLEGRHSAKEFA